MTLEEIVTTGATTYQEHKTAQNARIAKRAALLAEMYALVVDAVADEMPQELRQYLTFAGDQTAHIYTDQPFALTLQLPTLKPIAIIVDARIGVDVVLKVDGAVYPSLSAAIGAAAQGV